MLQNFVALIYMQLYIHRVATTQTAAAAAADEKAYFSNLELVSRDRTASSKWTVPRDVVLSRTFAVRFRIDFYRIRSTYHRQRGQ